MPKVASSKVTPIKAAPSKKAKASLQEQTQTIELPFVKSTKNTHVYGLDPNDNEMTPAICKQVYLNKEVLPEDPPSSIELIVKYKA